ncbi:unnamed protein product [Moneuplotes crassus]|uniref:Uncharacterized protein n=1 Tax=Euplotes crassus TaxID=5936 RepID=A0AAD1Y399_EUPCR|nr:unnamed protein product [Moneuplotes crassus]
MFINGTNRNDVYPISEQAVITESIANDSLISKYVEGTLRYEMLAYSLLCDINFDFCRN